MSSVSRWSYTNTAQVRPLVGYDGETGGTTYGTVYEIACTWTAEAKEYRETKGIEFVSTHSIFTEDPRPGYRDEILLNSTGATWQEIRLRIEWDMSMFSGDSPDYKLVT